MGEGDRVEWLYWDYWRRGRWKPAVAIAVYFGCFMSLTAVERAGFGLGLVVGSLLGGVLAGASMVWIGERQWPLFWELSLAERRRVQRGIRSGTSPEDARLARALLDRVEARDQLLRQQDGFVASSARFEQTAIGAVALPLVIMAGAVVFAVVEFGNDRPIAGTTVTILATGLAVSAVSDLVRRLRGNDIERSRAAAVAAAQEVLAAERTA